MNDKVVIAGTVKLRNTIKAKTNLHNAINGTPSWVVNTGGGGIVYPHYSGSYTVTPSTSAQVLDTSDKVMDDDVTVQAVPQGSATTPATIITADPTISVSSGGLITSTVSKTQQITPTVVEGYVSAGTPGNVGVSGSNTQQLTTQGAQTIHPASTDQSIASGKYLTGAQTFKAVTVSGLTADKVLQGNVVKIGDADDDDRIMSVTGTASGGITPTGTKSITANGTGIDVYSYQYADVAVPNSYSASDEGKVVSNGALVAQTSDTVTANDTYDTTLINSLTVNVSGGITEAQPKDVNFYDYDGTLVYSYTRTEWANVSALPANPSHSGLTAQGWNYTKAEIDSILAWIVEPINIGQTYVTASGDTEIDIELAFSNYLTPTLNLCPNGTATIDWGDGSAVSTVTGTSVESRKTASHTYASTGRYTIKITVSGTLGFNGYANNNGTPMVYNGSSSSEDNADATYQNSVINIRFGSNVTQFRSIVFSNMNNLRTVTFPTGVSFVGGYTFSRCAGLQCIVMPRGTTMDANMFYYCGALKTVCGKVSGSSRQFQQTYALRYVNIADDATSLGGYFISYQNALTIITVPASVTTISGNCFSRCRALKEIHIRGENVTLSNSNAFEYISGSYVIYVPNAKLEDYKAASNWSSLASHIQGE